MSEQNDTLDNEEVSDIDTTTISGHDDNSSESETDELDSMFDDVFSEEAPKAKKSDGNSAGWEGYITSISGDDEATKKALDKKLETDPDTALAWMKKNGWTTKDDSESQEPPEFDEDAIVDKAVARLEEREAKKQAVADKKNIQEEVKAMMANDPEFAKAHGREFLTKLVENSKGKSPREALNETIGEFARLGQYINPEAIKEAKKEARKSTGRRGVSGTSSSPDTKKVGLTPSQLDSLPDRFHDN